MIITVTPFPSIEYIYGIDSLKANAFTPSKNVSLSILSKGVYSAQMMKVLQEEPILLGSLGGFAGKSIKHYLDKAKVKSDIVWTDYETPHHVRIMIEGTSDYYVLYNEESFTIEKELIKLTHKIKSHIKKVSTMVLSGKLPHGQDATIYARWIKEAKLHNVKTVVSTGQLDIFNLAKSEKPYAIMLTLEQLEQLGYKTNSYEEIIKQMRPLLEEGIHFIMLYLKDRGALCLTKTKYCLVESTLQYTYKQNTASSGAFLGALAIGINRRYELEKCAKLCLGAALAADDNVNHKICTRKDVESRAKKTRVKQLIL